MSAERRGASRMGAGGTSPPPPRCAAAPRLRTDLHSPAGVRPKFRHSLEHIVPGKEPRPPGKELRPAGSPLPSTGPARAPGVQAGAGRVTWAARGGGGRRRADGHLLHTRGVRLGHSAPRWESGAEAAGETAARAQCATAAGAHCARAGLPLQRAGPGMVEW